MTRLCYNVDTGAGRSQEDTHATTDQRLDRERGVLLSQRAASQSHRRAKAAKKAAE